MDLVLHRSQVKGTPIVEMMLEVISCAYLPSSSTILPFILDETAISVVSSVPSSLILHPTGGSTQDQAERSCGGSHQAMAHALLLRDMTLTDRVCQLAVNYIVVY